MPPRKSKQAVISERKSDQRVMAPKRSSQRVVSPKRSSQRVVSPKRSSQRVVSPKRSSQRVVSPKRSSQRVKSPKIITSPEKGKQKKLVAPTESNGVQKDNTEKKDTIKGSTCQKAVKSLSMISSSFYQLFIENAHSDFDADPLSESEDEESSVVENDSGQVHSEESDIPEDFNGNWSQSAIANTKNNEELAAAASSDDGHYDSEASGDSFQNDEDMSIEDDVMEEDDNSEEEEEDSEEEEEEEDSELTDSVQPLVIPTLSQCNDVEVTTTSDMVEIMNDDNEAEFNTLKNSEMSARVIAFLPTDFNDSVKSTLYRTMQLKSAFPGVFASAFHKFKGVSVGYLKICPKTIKPFERAANVVIIYTLMQGEVVLKSNAFDVIDNTRVLQKQVIKEGTSLSIPEGHPYALENRTDCDVILQYVVIQ